MIHNIDAIYDHGVFRPVAPLALLDGARVHLRVEEENGAEPPTLEAEGELPTLLERMKGFVGTVHDLPPDSSVNLDHYLYGTPKRQ
ncbi:MAG: antitoxin family protein [Pirellulales bacterium]